MSETTSIQWCDSTLSPWYGCRKVSVCCENCCITSTPPYRMRGLKHGSQRVRVENFADRAFKLDQKAKKLRKRLKVFPSLCDIFDREVQIPWRDQFWQTVQATPNLDWLILTKRAADMESDLLHRPALPNVWLGVSVGCQADADKFIPHLQNTAATVRFLSVEPLLEPVNLRLSIPLHCINWVIVGGESGPHARPCNIDWIRDVVRQCREAQVPVFVKQLGSRPVFDILDTQQPYGAADRKGGNPDQWPEDLRVRQWPKGVQ